MIAEKLVLVFIAIWILQSESSCETQNGYSFAVYKRKPDGIDSQSGAKNRIGCAMLNTGMTYAGAKISEGDQTCTGLTREWQQNRTAESGSLYIEKSESGFKFQPPFIARKSDTINTKYVTSLPFVIQEGSGYDVYVSVDDTQFGFKSQFLDGTGRGYALNMAFKGSKSKISFNTKINEIWQTEVSVLTYPIVSAGLIYRITIKAETGGYRLSVDGVHIFLYTDARPFNTAKSYRFAALPNSRINLHEIVFFSTN